MIDGHERTSPDVEVSYLNDGAWRKYFDGFMKNPVTQRRLKWARGNLHPTLQDASSFEVLCTNMIFRTPEPGVQILRQRMLSWECTTPNTGLVASSTTYVPSSSLTFHLTKSWDNNHTFHPSVCTKTPWNSKKAHVFGKFFPSCFMYTHQAVIPNTQM